MCDSHMGLEQANDLIVFPMLWDTNGQHQGMSIPRIIQFFHLIDLTLVCFQDLKDISNTGLIGVLQIKIHNETALLKIQIINGKHSNDKKHKER